MAPQYVSTAPFMAATNPTTVAQACMNIAAAMGAISGPLIIGALTKANVRDGWRTFYVSALPPFAMAHMY